MRRLYAPQLRAGMDPLRVCEIGGFPVDKDGPACISVLPKNKKDNGNDITRKKNTRE